MSLFVDSDGVIQRITLDETPAAIEVWHEISWCNSIVSFWMRLVGG